MTLRRTKLYYKKLKLALQQKKKSLLGKSVSNVKKKPNLFKRAKKKTKKAFISFKKHVRKKPLPVEEPCVIERRVSIALSDGLEPPEISELAQFHEERRQIRPKNSPYFWMNDSRVYSGIRTNEYLKASVSDVTSANELFTEYINGEQDETEKDLIGDKLVGSLFNMHRAISHEIPFECILPDGVERIFQDQPKRKPCKAPIMCTVDNKEWIERMQQEGIP